MILSLGERDMIDTDERQIYVENIINVSMSVYWTMLFNMNYIHFLIFGTVINGQ